MCQNCQTVNTKHNEFQSRQKTRDLDTEGGLGSVCLSKYMEAGRVARHGSCPWLILSHVPLLLIMGPHGQKKREYEQKNEVHLWDRKNHAAKIKRAKGKEDMKDDHMWFFSLLILRLNDHFWTSISGKFRRMLSTKNTTRHALPRKKTSFAWEWQKRQAKIETDRNRAVWWLYVCAILDLTWPPPPASPFGQHE